MGGACWHVCVLSACVFSARRRRGSKVRVEGHYLQPQRSASASSFSPSSLPAVCRPGRRRAAPRRTCTCTPVTSRHGTSHGCGGVHPGARRCRGSELLLQPGAAPASLQVLLRVSNQGDLHFPAFYFTFSRLKCPVNPVSSGTLAATRIGISWLHVSSRFPDFRALRSSHSSVSAPHLTLQVAPPPPQRLKRALAASVSTGLPADVRRVVSSTPPPCG